MTTQLVSTLSLLSNLTDALASANSVFPVDRQTLLPPSDGISLLDVKNDLLLSYLQNLVFLILLRLRNSSGDDDVDSVKLNDNVTKKLIELRVYIERGVRPLEGKLRYQIDKVLRAAEEVDRLANQKTASTKSKNKKNKQRNGLGRSNNDDGSDVSGEESASEQDSDESEERNDEEFQERMYRPNTAALVQKARDEQKVNMKSRAGTTGAYKPPRITPTAMPEMSAMRDRDSDRSARRRKSHLVDEYIDEEMSSAPKAQPSIGSNSTILDRGRRGLSEREREKQREKTEYEERNLVRLPTESKAERRKARLQGERDRRDMFGGEDWTGLGGMGDRIHRSVAGKGSSSALERREKRKAFTEDMPRGDGMGIGDAFDRRRKVLEDRTERKRRKRA